MSETKRIEGCWAHLLSDCSGRLSREHPLPHRLIDGGPVDVQGPLWPGPKSLPPKAAVVKVLCERHNNYFGQEVDPAGTHALQSLQKFLQVRYTRRSTDLRQQLLQRYTIDGPLFERFLLKVTIDYAVHLPGPDEDHWTPPLRWVEVAFARSELPAGCGLHVGSIPEGAPDNRNEVRIEFPTRDPSIIEAAQLVFNGWSFVLSMSGDLQFPGHGFRPLFVRDRRGGRLMQVVKVEW